MARRRANSWGDNAKARYVAVPIELSALLKVLKFEGIGVKLSANVRLVVSTHWHDDHIRGLAKIYEKCESAEFVCAYGLEKDQFATLVSLYSREFPAGGSGLQEFKDVLLTLKKRKQGQRFIAPIFVGEDTVLNLGPRAVVKALSPSSGAVLAALAKFNEHLPEEGQRRSAVPSVGSNDLAIVLSVRIDETPILLGADLERGGDPTAGWAAIVERFSEAGNSQHQATRFRIMAQKAAVTKESGRNS